MVQLLQKTVYGSLKKLKIELHMIQQFHFWKFFKGQEGRQDGLYRQCWSMAGSGLHLLVTGFRVILRVLGEDPRQHKST